MRRITKYDKLQLSRFSNFLIKPYHTCRTGTTSNKKGDRGCDRMVVGLTTTCPISTYHHYNYEFESHSWRGVLNTTLCDKVYE